MRSGLAKSLRMRWMALLIRASAESGVASCPQHASLWSLQHAVQDLALVGRRQRRRSRGALHQAQHAHPRIHQFGGDSGDVEGLGLRRGLTAPGGGVGGVAQQRCDDARVQRQAHRQVRFAAAGRVHGTHRRQVHGHDEIGGRVVVEGLLTHRHGFAALQDQVDHRLVYGRQGMLRDLALHHGNAGNTRMGAPVLGMRRERRSSSSAFSMATLDTHRRGLASRKAGIGRKWRGSERRAAAVDPSLRITPHCTGAPA
jgi:hypothetical protein